MVSNGYSLAASRPVIWATWLYATSYVQCAMCNVQCAMCYVLCAMCYVLCATGIGK